MESDPQSLVDSALAMLDQDRRAEAAVLYKQIFAEDPMNRTGLVGLADAMERLGEFDTCLALLADSIDYSAPDIPGLLRISDLLRKVGRFEESADILLGALGCAPGDAALRLKTEESLEVLGRTAQLEWVRSGCEGELPLG
jgi:tetratricopeptide (TPR) repeat protein